jgi:hypothetical protein
MAVRRSLSGLFPRSLAAAILSVVLATGPGISPAAGAPAPPPIQFASAQFSAVGWLRTASLDNNGTARADMDNDGREDVVMVAPWLGSRVDIMYGNGNGTFRSPAQQIWAGLWNSNVILGDYNRDGRQDFAVTGASSFTVVLNEGGRDYRVDGSYFLQQSPFQNTGSAADFNNDGFVDLALKTPLGIQVMLGVGDGDFRYGPFTIVPGVPGALASIDDANLDSDPHRDLVASDAATQQVFALTNRGDGSFTIRDRATVPVAPTTVRAGDLDHTGRDSVVVLPEVNPPSFSAAVLVNDGSGGFRAPTYYPAGFADPVGELGDFNDDGHLDIASVNTFSGDIVVLAGVGDGTFSTGGTFGTSVNAQTPAIGDFNMDGRSDIAVPVNCPGISGLLGKICLATLINRR